jgi:predicted dithiol-disulfide oxidoreductase (DUF899 family)
LGIAALPIGTPSAGTNAAPTESKMNQPTVVSRAEWLVARKELLAKEKEFSRARDALSASRRQLPMVKIEKEYLFDGAKGKVNLRALFDRRRQLIVYHFMLDPNWEEGCKSCSYIADHFEGGLVHLSARDTSFAAVSRAPLAKIEAFKKRMGWTFPWLSSFNSDFNYDFHVTLDKAKGSTEYNYEDTSKRDNPGYGGLGERPGLSVFLLDGDQVFHTYSTYERGLDILIGTYNYLDLTPLGRQEEGSRGMSWVRLHDKYA